jgi:hypothetical protein
MMAGSAAAVVAEILVTAGMVALAAEAEVLLRLLAVKEEWVAGVAVLALVVHQVVLAATV